MNTVLLLLVGLTSISIIYYLSYAYKKHHMVLNTNKKKLYFQHPDGKLNSISKQVLDEINLKHTSNFSDNWILYIPKNYNYVEIELAKLIPSNNQQIIYAIKGCDALCSKNQLWFNLRSYYGREKAQTIIPETFNLNDKDDIDIFKEKYFNNNDNTATKTTFILKKNLQGKKGLHLVNNSERALREGKLNNFKIIQKYLENPYLINKRKVNLRLYVVIICHLDKEEWLLFNEGKCIYSNKFFDKGSSLDDKGLLDKEQHFTSYNLDTNKVYLDENLPESLQDFKIHLGDEKYEKLMENINKLLLLVKSAYSSRLGKIDTLKNNKCFQLFGLDFLMDENLKPYLLEFNKGPAMSIKSPKDKELKHSLLLSMFKLLLFNIKQSNFAYLI